MKRYEIALEVLDEKYVDSLIVALVRQGYDVYYNDDEKKVCFTASYEDVIEIKENVK